ncbi:hypothetical protein [Fibrivirga algicola]|uniref:Uncharacterized protein n=1 Tax=Fibrivirga algicola TaxID=2950420 RepID=A0ABX0QDR3_9BACT|nr:hypothetical protein [Fibrivirga algicola]NID09360.1 hypothetical protein [Fibrivirga algicola]
MRLRLNPFAFARFLLGLFVVGTLLLAFSAKAQIPPYVPDPINQVIQLQKDLNFCRWTLEETRKESKTVIAEKKHEIDSLTTVSARLDNDLTVTMQANVLLANGEVQQRNRADSLQARLYKIEGRTIVGKGLRKVAKTAAWVGWADIILRTIQFIPR